MNNTTTIMVNGKQFTLKNTLTIGEQLSLEGTKQALCNGQWGALFRSSDPGDIAAAYNAQIVAELNTRIVKAPEGWKGADQETDIKYINDIWKEFAVKANLFRGKDAGKQGSPKRPAKEGGEGASGSKLSEDMVQDEIQSSADQPSIPVDDR